MSAEIFADTVYRRIQEGAEFGRAHDLIQCGKNGSLSKRHEFDRPDRKIR